ncbi:MAG: SGNH/GDSL hydrolase family protein, partial [Oscillospiraceae bacterium]|nr:SGNH/GDSL hydrolase family protein [Oscillospiraceae bacterium]
MKNFWKRTISLVLAVMMAFGTMPATVLAIELETVSEELLPEEEFAENPAEEQPEEDPKPDFGTISLEPENTEPLWSEAEPLAENQWSGKSAVFVGDSITAGVGTTKLYYEYLDEALDFGSVTAMGVSGSCMSTASDYGTKNQPLITRYQNIPSADLIMVFMGTNDYGHETPLGTEEDTGDGTFYGVLNVIVPALVEKHTASKIVFVTSLHRYGFGTSGILGTKFTYDNIPNGVGASLGDYVDALKTVCAKNGVSVIDLFTEYPLDPTDADVREEYIPDGVHPNAAGHKILAEIMESHIREYEPIAKEAENYRWEVKNDTLESVGKDKNNLSILAGSVTNGKLNSVHASLSKVIKLYHNRPWTVEWKASGNWSGFLFSENSNNAAKGNRYLYKSYMSGALIALGEYDGEKHQNYGIDAEEHKIDFSGEHIYRVENRINPDGSNMAYLIVDGIEKGAMDGHYINGSGDQNSNVNWVSGKDYSFSYIGTAKYPVKDGVFEYIAVWENGKPEISDFTGKTISILGDSISTYTGVSNNAQYNPALGKNVGFYPVNDVTSRKETWWQQTADLLGMEVLVNNSSGGGRVLSDETFSRISGGAFSSSIRNEAAYKNRCVSLHNTNGENPEVILVFLGTNDFSYHLDAENCEACSVLAECSLCKGTNTCENCVKTSGFGSSFCLASLGTADIGDYLITENQDGTFAYSVPKTACEAYAVMLHKIIRAYPDAEVFCLGLLPRRSPDYSGGYHDHGQPTDFN